LNEEEVKKLGESDPALLIVVKALLSTQSVFLLFNAYPLKKYEKSDRLNSLASNYFMPKR
jgi:hypothetical protein